MYFDKVDEGEQVIVQRGKNKSYVLTPVKEDDMYFNEEMFKQVKESLLQARKGEFTEISSSEGIKDLLGL